MKLKQPFEKGHLNKGGSLNLPIDGEATVRGRKRAQQKLQAEKAMKAVEAPALNWGSGK